MQEKEAIALIQDEKFKPLGQQLWYDLGAGSGTFTIALATLLEPGSRITAIDKNSSSLRQIPKQIANTEIELFRQDFALSNLPYDNYDGILMANSIHYIKDKSSFITKIVSSLKQSHKFLFVEYDTEKSNPWVPYPMGFSLLKQFFTEIGYKNVIKLHERKSRYNRSMMYSAVVDKV